jgi:hypothetical protein
VGLSFLETVQPVLDRYCIECHGLKETAADVNLLGTLDPAFERPVEAARKLRANTAYHSLIKRPGLVAYAQAYQEGLYSTPGDFGSVPSRLTELLLSGHPDKEGNARVELDPTSLTRMIHWMDLNAQFYGGYSWNKPAWRKVSAEGETALRAYVRQTFGPELADQPLDALINRADLAQSRILLAPLAKNAGGWGQITPSFTGTSEPRYRRLHELVEGVLEPLEYHDIAGTSGRPDDPCWANWVRAERERFLHKRAESASGK